MRLAPRSLKLTAALLLLCLAAAGCIHLGNPLSESASPSSSDPAPTRSDPSNQSPAYQPYKEPVTLHVGFLIPDSKLPPGDSNDNNPISRYFEALTNIRVIHSWEAKGSDAYKQKVDFAIASNDIPDAMVVDRNQLRTLVKNGMIQDLTETYKSYASELVRTIYDSTQGSALRDATFGGKLYGLPNVALDADSPSLLWVREDWLEKLHLAPPKTMDDIERIAQAFTTQDPNGNGKNDTVGLTGFKGIVYGQKPLSNGFDSIFHYYYAFPKNWIKNSDGSIVYGSITPQTKQALEKLADWYRRGLIDKNFALYNEVEEPIIENKTGMFFGPWWMPYYPLNFAVEKDTKAEWRAYAAPMDSAGTYVTHMAPATDRYLVVKRGYPHPEAALKLLNAFTRLERNRDPNIAEVNKLKDYVTKTGVQPRNLYPFDLLLDYSNSIEQRYLQVQKALNGDLRLAELDPDALNVYRSMMAERENPKKDIDHWKVSTANQYGAGVLASTSMRRVHSVFHGSTPTMETKWAELQKLENEAFLKIIIGDQPVSSFDDFVAKWRELGGDRITKEVADAVNKP
ncbi:extracellular solute-binding protein [Paenibacillus chartarius]|uniref:Extracellular solute-binding protein n=1 Tax=Paenibacillus chartarius TaxID=747481 RepID=A0ABV6DL63_9BACL